MIFDQTVENMMTRYSLTMSTNKEKSSTANRVRKINNKIIKNETSTDKIVDEISRLTHGHTHTNKLTHTKLSN